MPFKKKKTAIFIMPRSSSSWEGAEAVWITVAGWAAAAKDILGEAKVITIDRTATPGEVLDYPIKKNPVNNSVKKRFSSYFPNIVKTILKDIVQWKNSRRWKIVDEVEYEKGDVAFVWEQHDLFSGPGRKLADKLEVPLILYVHAPVVWEASKWGVNRGVWGSYLEKYVEKSSLEKADLIAVVSENVKQKIVKMGISPEKVLVSPMAVDPQLFLEGNLSEEMLRKKLGLEGKTVIGWTGSFRSFHGIHYLVKAFNNILDRYPNCVLLLVGDGSERKEAEQLSLELGISQKVIFVGRKPFREIPQYVSVFDIAVVSAKNVSEFHYSPLKLREYLAAGKPVLAPNAGEIPVIFHNETHLKLFEAGDVESLSRGLEFYLSDKINRKEIGERGRDFALSTSTWESELRKSLNRLEHNKQ